MGSIDCFKDLEVWKKGRSILSRFIKSAKLSLRGSDMVSIFK
jgi:hypothetical protein